MKQEDNKKKFLMDGDSVILGIQASVIYNNSNSKLKRANRTFGYDYFPVIVFCFIFHYFSIM